MVRSLIVSLLFLVFAQDSTYYVAKSGSDTTTCGTETSPCKTINQVINNYPGASYSVSISPNTYITDEITLQRSAVVIFQGNGNTTIYAYWDGGIFITNTNTSGFEMHDLAISIDAMYGTCFSILIGVGNIAGFYNIVLTFVLFPHGDFMGIYGGTLVFNNLTCNGQAINSSLVTDASTDNGDDSNISIIGSTFSSLTLFEIGGIVQFTVYKNSNITLDSNSFYNVSSLNVLIALYPAEGGNPTITISNNAFDSIESHEPNVFFGIANQCSSCVINVQNTTWNGSVAYDVSGAVGIYGSHDRQDHRIIFNNLSCYNCRGNYSGGLFVGFNSLNLSNSVFGNNTAVGGRGRAGFGNDVVQGLDPDSTQFGYSITNCYSSSALPKAAIWNLSSDAVVDISDLLPAPSKDIVFFQNQVEK